MHVAKKGIPMKFKHLSLLFTFCFLHFYSAQAQNNDVLFTIENEPVFANEFIRVYNKNLDLVKDESQKDVNTYLKLFINYKLKLHEAKQMKLDTKPTYIRELASNKKQLSKNYLLDSKITNTLVEEAYRRIEQEVNANHILVRLDQNAVAKDTLAAYNQVLKLSIRAQNEGYNNVQKEIHNGETVFAEKLGFFSAFKMVYAFENAAYKTAVGKFSKPFRTRFGYHVVQVLDKRISRGEVTVAHIMLKDVNTKPNNTKTKINEIYQRLKQGEAFDALAKQFSEDNSTASNGGLLKPFSGGELSIQIFEDQAFNLKEKGELSKPFQSKFGWHIIKLIDKKPLPAFKDLKATLETKIKRDARSKIINTSRVNALKKKYTIVKNQDAIPYFKSIVNDDFKNKQWKLPEDFQSKKTLFSIQDKKITYQDFALFLLKSQRNNSTFKTTDVIINDNYNAFLEAELLKYQEDNLINENEEFAQIVGEYRDGLLLFDLMESEIWNAAKKDTVALQKYYDAYKSNYYFNARVNAIVASSAKKATVKKVAKLLNQNKSIENIKKEVNTKKVINVSFTSGEMDRSHQAFPKPFNFKKGVSKIYKHNDAYVVVKVNAVLPKSQKSFEEAKGKLISDYQDFKESNWLKELALKYTVKVNKEVFNAVKKTLN